MKPQINKKLMVFESSPDFSDNSRGLWEYVEKNTDYETFWVIKDQKMLELLKGIGVNCDLEGGDLANEMIAKARFLITSSFNFTYQKNTEQIHVAAWHGFPLKLIGFFDSASSDPSSFDLLKIITTQSDIITTTSRLSQLTMSGMFAVDPRKVKETGFPRNDIMFWYDGKEELKKITNIDVEKSKLILYLPTMRKGLKSEGAQFEDNIFNYSDYDANRIDEFLESQNAYIFVKMHFADNELLKSGDFVLPKRMIFLDTYALNKHFLTIYHIMNAFDVLLTDYSSVYVDFLLLNRPIIFSCPDLKQYKHDRGFVVDDPSLLMPGPIIESQVQLLDNLKVCFENEDAFCAVREEKMAFFHLYDDANSSKRLLDEMEQADKYGVKDSAKEMGRYFLNDSPLSQYSKDIKIELYFDTGNGFNEEVKYAKIYRMEAKENKLAFEVDLPQNTKIIRLDPDDIGRCMLKDFSVWFDDISAPYVVMNGSEIDKCIFPESNDLQILVPLEDKPYSKVKLKYQCIDLYADVGKVEGELKRELMMIYASRSWKLAVLFKKIGGIARKFLKR